MGIHPYCFSWELKCGESFQTPEVVMVYSDKGLNAVSQTYHYLYQKRLARGLYRDQVRPILVNNWKGTYFYFNEEKIMEMVNKDSVLYHEHSEWTLKTPNRNSCHGRNQYVLDFSNPKVVDYIYEMMVKVIEEGQISYIKWDMNRCMSEVYSSLHNPSSQGKGLYFRGISFI